MKSCYCLKTVTVERPLLVTVAALLEGCMQLKIVVCLWLKFAKTPPLPSLPLWSFTYQDRSDQQANGFGRQFFKAFFHNCSDKVQVFCGHPSTLCKICPNNHRRKRSLGHASSNELRFQGDHSNVAMQQKKMDITKNTQIWNHSTVSQWVSVILFKNNSELFEPDLYKLLAIKTLIGGWLFFWKHLACSTMRLMSVSLPVRCCAWLSIQEFTICPPMQFSDLMCVILWSLAARSDFSIAWYNSPIRAMSLAKANESCW